MAVVAPLLWGNAVLAPVIPGPCAGRFAWGEGIAGLAGITACDFRSGFLSAAGSPRNSSLSLPAIACFMNVIQMGRAALAPVSFSPRDSRLSYPTHTPHVTEGENPRNQASV